MPPLSVHGAGKSRDSHTELEETGCWLRKGRREGDPSMAHKLYVGGLSFECGAAKPHPYLGG